MIKGIFKGKEVAVPEHVDELTHEQYRRLLKLAMLLNYGALTVRDFMVSWLSWLLGLRNYLYTDLVEQYRTETERFMPAMAAFVTRTHDGRDIARLDTVCNLMPVFSEWQGPGDFLHGVKFGEFVRCLNLLREVGGGDSDAAVEMARVLYHIPDGSTPPPELVLHSVTLFSAVWEAIVSAPVQLNGEPVDLGIIFKPAGGSKIADDHTGWAGVTFEVAAAGVFGTVKDVDEAPYLDVLLYLYKMKFEYLHDKTNMK